MIQHHMVAQWLLRIHLPRPVVRYSAHGSEHRSCTRSEAFTMRVSEVDAG